MFRNVIPGNEMQIIGRDITGPVGTGQRFGAEKRGAAAPDSNSLCQATPTVVRSAFSQSLFIEIGRVTDSMEQSLRS